MRIIYLIFGFMAITSSLNAQEFTTYSDTIELNLPGKLSYFIPFKNKLYFNQSIYNSPNSSHYDFTEIEHYYELDKNKKLNELNLSGNTNNQIYYQFFERNQKLYFLSRGKTYHLANNGTFQEKQNFEPIIFEDDLYIVYSVDEGEWGGLTWIKNKKSGKEYGYNLVNPVINRFKNKIILGDLGNIYEINDLEKEKTANYTYSKYLEKGWNYELKEKPNQLYPIFTYKNEYFNPNFVLISILNSNNIPYYLYKFNKEYFIGKIENGIMVDNCKIEGISNLKRNITLNQTDNPTFQFSNSDSMTGFIEIIKDEIYIHYVKNSFNNYVYSSKESEGLVSQYLDLFIPNLGEIYTS